MMRLFRSGPRGDTLELSPDAAAAIAALEQCARLPACEAPDAIRERLQTVSEAQARLRRTERRLVVYGGLKTGKSTLINALIGAPLLPARTNRATAVPATLRHGPRPAATITRAIGAETCDEEIAFDDIARHVLLDTSGPGARAPEGIVQVTLDLPHPLLRDGCQLVDTPALLDADELSTRSMQAIEDADLGIMVLAADRLLSEGEKQTAARVNALLDGDLIFVINRIDAVERDERESVIAWAHAGLEGLGNEVVGCPRIFAIEAKTALEASGKQKRETGVGELEHWLREQFSGHTGERVALRSRLSLLGIRLSELQECCQTGQQQSSKQLAQLRRTAALREEEAATRRHAHRAESAFALAQLRDALDQRREGFVEDCVLRAGALAKSGPPTPGQLDAALQQAVRSFTQAVRRDAQSAASPTGVVVGSFILEVESPFNPAQRLVGIGRWLAKGGLRADLGAATRDEMRRVAGSISRLLQTEAEQYLTEIEQGLQTAPEAEPPPPGEMAEIEAAVRSDGAWRVLAEWCERYQSALAGVRRTLQMDER